MSRDTQSADHFERAGKTSKQSLAREFLGFMKYYKKWWLFPVLLLLMLLSALVILGSSGAAPFIYTLF
jgi:hypothetical protein